MPNPAAASTIDRKSAGEYCFARSDGSDNVNSGHDALAKANAWGMACETEGEGRSGAR